MKEELLLLCEGLCSAPVILQGNPLETALTDRPGHVLLCFQGHTCNPCPEKWLQYGNNCYYFSKERKTWQESKAQWSDLDMLHPSLNDFLAIWQFS
uniref:Uncharacterized protein n=1 Tax=Dromaius novaehollandiae TaxID=8790 RepID=A0A8C4JT55_DRONO